MGFRFSRRVRVLPGVRLNFGARGTSVSIGHRGAWLTLGPHGRRRATLGFPGTGISYSESYGGHTAPRRPGQAQPARHGFLSACLVIVVSVVALCLIFGN